MKASGESMQKLIQQRGNGNGVLLPAALLRRRSLVFFIINSNGSLPYFHSTSSGELGSSPQ